MESMTKAATALLATFGLFLGGLGVKAQQPLSPPWGPPPTPTVGPGPCLPQTHTICVREPKHHTTTAYACKDEEYCLPQRSFFALLCGKSTCAEGHCGNVRIRHRL